MGTYRRLTAKQRTRRGGTVNRNGCRRVCVCVCGFFCMCSFDVEGGGGRAKE